MRKYLLAALCFVALHAVALDVFLLHAQVIRAAVTGSRLVRVQSVGAGGPARISGERGCRDAAPYERGTLFGARLGHSERSDKQRK